MNHTLPTIAIALSLGTLIPCQTKVAAKLMSRSLLQASATAPSGQVARSVQSGVDVTKPFDLLVQTPQKEAAANYVVITDGGELTGWRVLVFDVGNATDSAAGAARAHSGVNVIRMDLATNRPTTANVAIHLKSRVFGPGALYGAQVDIQSDGKIEFAASQTVNVRRNFTAAIGPQGLSITITTGGTTGLSVPTLRKFAGNLTIEVRRLSGCSNTPFGKGCLAGPQLTGRMTWDHEVAFAMQADARNTPAVLVLGTGTQSVPLPSHGFGCNLLIDLGVLVFSRTDPQGRVTIKVPVPVNLKANANAQMFTLGQLHGLPDIRSTQGLRVTCQ